MQNLPTWQFDAALSMVNGRILVIDEDAKLLAATRAAKLMLAAGDDLCLRERRLSATRSRNRRTLSGTLARQRLIGISNRLPAPHREYRLGLQPHV